MSCCLLFNVGNQVQFHASRSLVEFSASVTHPTFNHFVSPSIQHLLSPFSSDAFSFDHSSCHNHDVTASLSSSYSRKRLVIPSTKKALGDGLLQSWACLGGHPLLLNCPDLAASDISFFSKTKQKKTKKQKKNKKTILMVASLKVKPM